MKKQTVLNIKGEKVGDITLNEYIEDEREVLLAHGQPLKGYGEMFELLRELIKKLVRKLNEETRGI